MKCRYCGEPLSLVVCDLVSAPMSNAYLSSSELDEPEIYYPLCVYVCTHCWLMQIEDYQRSHEIFGDDYRYYSSYSSLWLQHAEEYVNMIVPRLGLSYSSKVMEIASNDGYLLQYFKRREIPCFGVDPAKGPAIKANQLGIETIVAFFNADFADELINTKDLQDLIIGNNVLAHVPDINNFVPGLAKILSPLGTVTMEFPHLLELIQDVQFDTIYHEHYFYLSLGTVESIFLKHGLRIYDVEKIFTHGGSLRIYACHADDQSHPTKKTVDMVLEEERSAGLLNADTYLGFQGKVDTIRNTFLQFLLKTRGEGKKIVGYGAAAKGNTLLNYCGIKGTGLIEFVADASPHKQGFYLPGSRIPIVEPERIFLEKPDYIIIFPWNIKSEIVQQLIEIRTWGGKFVTPIPELEVIQG
ncbi:MAG: methyltransferase domain-containing protein [Methanospirillaceae archaeon]|nr:methyltransferase domain-containing protein [Methanospirillaceae archaeon]